MLQRQIILLDPLLLYLLSPMLHLPNVIPHSQDTVVKFLDRVVHLDDVLLTDEAVLVGDQFVDLDELAGIVGVEEEEELVAQLAICAWGFALG